MIADNWDLAIRIGRLADSPLQARRLADCAMRVCAAPTYLDSRGVPRRIAELAQHNCLGYTLTAMQDGSHWAFGLRGEFRVPASGNLMANNGDALLAAAVGGQGIIYQPDFIVATALERGELVALELGPVVDLGGIPGVSPTASTGQLGWMSTIWPRRSPTGNERHGRRAAPWPRRPPWHRGHWVGISRR